jgi:hypothetical protein
MFNEEPHTMPDPSPPAYLTAALDLAGDVRPGEVRDVFILHDDTCTLLAGGACVCTPTVTRGFVLWHRKGRRFGWEALTVGPTERQCYDAIKASGRKGGDWLVLPAGKQP